MTIANVSDRKGAVAMVLSAKKNLLEVKNILVDAGYTGEKFATYINWCNCRGG